MKKITVIIFILFSGFSTMFGQEILTGLSVNPVIKKYLKKNPEKRFKASDVYVPASLTLPFFEDFKQKDIYPDTLRWFDNEVFVNTDFSYRPPSWGVATFDAVDADGNIYPEANPLQFVADHLTSQPIRLDSVFDPVPKQLTPSDSVYFSFYYQPQGRGNDPQERDSLVLQFGYFTNDTVL